MSKFDELSRAVTEYDRQGIEYRLRSTNTMAKILAGFVQYLQAPIQIVRFFPFSAYGTDASYNPHSAAELNDEGWWDSGLSLKMDSPSRHYVGFRFRMRTEMETFQVRVGDSEKLHSFVTPTDEELSAVWDEAFSRSNLYLTTGLQRFLDSTRSEQTGKIGFV